MFYRTINTKTGGSSFVEKFQDEITGRIAEISKDYLNRYLHLHVLPCYQLLVSLQGSLKS